VVLARLIAPAPAPLRFPRAPDLSGAFRRCRPCLPEPALEPVPQPRPQPKPQPKPDIRPWPVGIDSNPDQDRCQQLPIIRFSFAVVRNIAAHIAAAQLSKGKGPFTHDTNPANADRRR